jgi:hypothetical protein
MFKYSAKLANGGKCGSKTPAVIAEDLLPARAC